MTDAETLGEALVELAQPEDTHSASEWEAAAAAVLRKTRRMSEEDPDSLVWDRLTRTTLDGIGVTPLGTPDLLDRVRTAGRPSRSGAWGIRAHLTASGGADAKVVNEQALVDLDGGVTSLWLHADARTDLQQVLHGVLLDLAPVVLDAPSAPQQAARALLRIAADAYVDLHPATNLGVDPLGASLRGVVDPGAQRLTDDLVAVAKLAQELGVLGVVVDATAAHDLGSSDAQELGYSLYAGITYLRVLTEAGLSVVEAARLIEFRYAATDEQFATIAKLRAARRAWARVLELCGVPADATVPQRQHAVTSRPMLSKYDPYVNMLRTTVAAFAAGVGGADSVTVLPFDSPLGRPEGFGRRIARNINHLLIDESHVAQVADPAGGAFAVEKLTDDLAHAGWEELGRLESDGIDAFGPRIEQVVAERERQIALRTRPITGLSEFPHPAETLPARDPDPVGEAVRRYGASFEALRDAPATQRVFLATLGPVAQHTARATFASNLLAAGGIGVDVAGPTTDAADLASKYAGQPVACLAGSDAAYSEWGAAAAQALREAGAGHVIIAGKPDSLRDHRVDDHCAMGVDALAFLTRTREKLA